MAFFWDRVQRILARSVGKPDVVEQILVWQVFGQVLGALMQPGLTELTKLVNSEFQTVPLTPAVLADMVVRNIVSPQEGADIARQSGIAPSDFHRLVLDTGEAPAPQQLIEALRRGIIQWDQPSGDLPSALQGLRQGHLRDEWASLMRELGFVPIGVSDAVDAVVEGQITHEQGAHFAYLNGVRGDDFQILVNTRGNPPSPSEVIEMVRRGKIPLRGTGPEVTSLQQAIFEGATKNKWEPVFEELTVAIPPPRTVVALVRAGTISDAQAARFLQDAGLSSELAAAYVAEAHHSKTAGHRELTVSTILDLYEQRVMPAKDATDLLEGLGYSAQDADFLEALKDLQREIKAVSSATDRIGKLYVARKIDATAVHNVLNQLQIPDAQIKELIAVWDQERALEVRTLTPAEVVAAFHWHILEQAAAQAELETLGFTAFDAWTLLSIREHGPLPNQPAPG